LFCSSLHCVFANEGKEHKKKKKEEEKEKKNGP
jgi:hypothetical protein